MFLLLSLVKITIVYLIDLPGADPNYGQFLLLTNSPNTTITLTPCHFSVHAQSPPRSTHVRARSIPSINDKIGSGMILSLPIPQWHGDWYVIEMGR